MREAEEVARLEELRWEEELRVQLAKEQDREHKKIEKAQAERLKLEEEQKRIEKEKHDSMEKAFNEMQQKAVDDYVRKLGEKRRMTELYSKNKTEWRLALAESLEQAKQNYKLKMQQMNIIEENGSTQNSTSSFSIQKNSEDSLEESDKKLNEEVNEVNMEKSLENIKRKASSLAIKRAKELKRQHSKCSIEDNSPENFFNPDDLVSILNDFSINDNSNSSRSSNNYSNLSYSTRTELPSINTSRYTSNSLSEISIDDALKNIKKKARELSEVKLKNNRQNKNNKESSMVFNKLDFSQLHTDSESETEREKLLKNIKLKARELSKSKLSARTKNLIEYALTSRSEQDLGKVNHNNDTETLTNDSRYYKLGLESIR